jgi:hypothetical protein
MRRSGPAALVSKSGSEADGDTLLETMSKGRGFAFHGYREPDTDFRLPIIAAALSLEYPPPPRNTDGTEIVRSVSNTSVSRRTQSSTDRPKPPSGSEFRTSVPATTNAIS